MPVKSLLPLLGKDSLGSIDYCPVSKDVKHNFKQVMVYAVHNDKLFSSYSGFLCEIKIFSLKSIL
jgi:hypothetical protein